MNTEPCQPRLHYREPPPLTLLFLYFVVTVMADVMCLNVLLSHNMGFT